MAAHESPSITKPYDREAVVHAHPRSRHFKEDIIQAFYDGIRHKPSTIFGNVKADVLADKDPDFKPANFCSMIRGSPWLGRASLNPDSNSRVDHALIEDLHQRDRRAGA
ncbi:MAG TPA: hypothetical protein VK822_28560 [Acetobacteraceae bacterium]|jgi:hypothetical protein|nr:hypothetical protein [Acetobacteraceae bacterium]